MRKLRIAAAFMSVCLLCTVLAGAKISSKTESRTMRPMFKVASHVLSTSPYGYSPAQLKAAYGIGSSFYTGKGKTIAIVTAYGSENLKSDLDVFDKEYNLPSANLSIHDCGVTKSDAGWAVETSLDVEWAHAIAPAAKLLVVEAVSDDSDDLLEAVDYAVNNGAQIVSMSWGTNEYDTQTDDDRHFSKSGVIFVASSGDDGASKGGDSDDWDNNDGSDDDEAGVCWPSSSPKVISVGGTSLDIDSGGKRLDETAWSYSGGGTSKYEMAPKWQNTFGVSSNSRSVPDVSLDADPSTGVSVYCSVEYKHDSGWLEMGGTSLSAPVWAAIIADLNQNSDNVQNAGYFYSLAGGTGYKNTAKSFFDITLGSNSTDKVDGYDAATGYDKVTGLGSPDCANLTPIKVSLGVSYSAHVQNIGWQKSVIDGALAGTTGKNLRVEGLKIKLYGKFPSGASITYKTYVQRLGWQAAVSNGALAGTSGKALRIEALRATIKGLAGYQVRYRVYVQKKGWTAWAISKNGTAIASAPIAGTVGKSLRIEAFEIKVLKAS